MGLSRQLCWCSLIIPIILSILLAVLNSDNEKINELLAHKVLSRFKTGVFCMQLREYDNKIVGYGDLPRGMSQGGIIGDMNEADKVCSRMIIVNNLAALNSGWLRGTVGIGETYFREEWVYDDSKHDLGDIITLIFWNVLNEATPFTAYLVYFSKFEWMEYFYRIGLTKDRSQDMIDIQYHYNGYQFFEKHFDSTLTYSCGYFNKTSQSLYEAQLNHHNILMHKLKLDILEQDKNIKVANVLNLGFGWGYLENYITNNRSTENTKYNVTGISISDDQLDFVLHKYKKQNNGNTRSPYYFLMDFRDVTKHYPDNFFDRALSVGVICHIHTLRLDEMFQVLYRVLKPGGYFLLDGITATSAFASGNAAWQDRRYGCTTTNFIYKYIFPGGCVLLADWIHESAVKAGFIVMNRDYSGQLYSKTLREWRFNLNRHKKYFLENNIVNKKRFLSYDMYYAQAEASFRVGKLEQNMLVFYKPHKKQIHKYNFDVFEKDIFVDFQ